MNSIEAQPDRTEELVDRMFGAMFGDPKEKKAIWANQVFEEYTNLPKGKSAERRKARDFILQTGRFLLANPQEIDIIVSVWESRDAKEENHDGQKEQNTGSFYDLVKQEASRDIRQNWEKVAPEQLAQLVKSDSDFAKKALTSYFKGPNSRNQRIDAHYNFVSGVLDLAGEDDAFKEGMRIALHGTDILPKKPSMIEQSILLSFPNKEEESPVFKKALVVNYIINQLRFMGLVGSDDIQKAYKARRNFIQTYEVKEELRKQQVRVAKAIGEDRTRELNNAMINFSNIIVRPLTEERRQSIKNIWPYNLAFDENDPLNQKFQRVQLQLASSV
ncbi:MAG: hypothetical protein AAB583_02200 [Patescibacteria group bacterium]